MENKKRNHISIVIEQSLGGILALLLILVTQGDDIIEIVKELASRSIWYILIAFFILVLAFGLVFIRNLLIWRKTYIWVENDNIIVERNTIFHKKNVYQIAHVSNIDLEQNVFEHAIGTCKIKIDTNSSITATKTDIKIVFSMEEAEAFKANILGEEALSAQEGHEEIELSKVDPMSEQVTHQADARDKVHYTAIETLRNALVGLHPLSIVAIVMFIGIGLFMSREGNENGPMKESWMTFISSAAPSIIVIIQSIYSYFRRFADTYDFHVRREKNRIFIEQGLLNRSRKTIPLEKINAIMIKQPFFARVFGLYQVELVNIGMGNDEKENSYLLLATKRDQLEVYMKALLPEYEKVIEQELKRPSRLFYLHSLYAWLIPLLCIIGIGYYTIIYRELLPSVVFYSGTAIIVVGYALVTVLRYQASGYALDESYMSMSRGIFTRTLTMVFYERIQNISISRPLISHITGLCDVDLSIIADAEHTVIDMPLMTECMSDRLIEKMMATTYLRRKNAIEGNREK